MNAKKESYRDIDKRLEELARQHGIIKVLNGILALFLGLLIITMIVGSYTDLPYTGSLSLFFFIALAVLGIVVAFWNSGIEGEQKRIALDYIPQVLDRVMDQLDVYDVNRSVNRKYLSEEMGFPDFNRITYCGDYVKGVLWGIPMEFSEFVLEKERTTRDEDGDSDTTSTVAFRGLMVICRHGLELTEDFTLCQFKKFGGIQTESDTFNRTFSIHCEDGHDVFRILTPPYMERLVSVGQDASGALSIRFRKDGLLLVVLKGWNLFEVEGTTSVAALQTKIEREMVSLANILSRLDVCLTKKQD